ncbi:MAG: hypothetical protein WAZ12_01570 [Candidatus Absconditicoccaceae bacterium]
MSDPILNDKVNEEKNNGSSGIFGGGEDVFENEELFRPLDGVVNKKSSVENQEEDMSIDINENEIIKNEEESQEEKFDPIFTEDDDIKKEDTVIEGIDEIPVVDFHEEEKTTHINEIENEDIEIQEENEEDIPVIINDASTKNKIENEPEEEKSDLMKKFGELVNKTKELYGIAKMEDSEYVELVGGDTGKSQIIYNLWLIQEDEEKSSILVSKIETDTESNDQQQNNLQFKDDNGSLEILLDEQLLYDEIKDLKEDQNKKMQVIDKLNKFIFLVSEELKVYERDKKEKERMEQERRKLRDIFRNF